MHSIDFFLYYNMWDFSFEKIFLKTVSDFFSPNIIVSFFLNLNLYFYSISFSIIVNKVPGSHVQFSLYLLNLF